MYQFDISIIVPTLNEEKAVKLLLQDLKVQSQVSFEVLIADGGSSDGTTEIAEKFDFVKVIACEKGRGRQMNSARQKALGEYLFFLHADTRIEIENLLKLAHNAMKSARGTVGNNKVAGHFQLEFIRGNSKKNAMAFRYAEEKMRFDRPNVVNGDQGLFLAASFFDELGGFDESMSFLEDQKIAYKIRKHGRWVLLPGKMKTSARRFEAEGFHRLYIFMSMIMGLYSVEAKPFFIRAPEIYRQQKDTEKLLLTPFFIEIIKMLREDYGFSGTVKLLFAIGKFVRSHSWQMFYFFDILFSPVLGSKKYVFLKFHDKVFWRLTNFWIFDVVTALATSFWFFIVLFPFFTIWDWKLLKAKRVKLGT